MLLCVDIGNKIISFGFFADDCELVATFDISSVTLRTSDEYASLIKCISKDKQIDLSNTDGAIISSVVPSLTDTLVSTIRELTAIEPLIVGPGVKTGFSIKIDNPSELGADMVANTAAAKMSVLPTVNCSVERDLIERLSELNATAYRCVAELRAADKEATSIADVEKRAEACRDKVIPAMNALRAAVDEMETMTSSEYWPMPSYSDLMFNI